MSTHFRGSNKHKETENTQLINNVEDEPQAKIFKCCKWRKIKLVEPLPVFYIATAVILEPVLQQYVYLRISEELGNNSTNMSDDRLSSLCNSNESSKTFKIQQETQHISSRFFMYITIVQVLLSCLPILILGNIVDIMGRKIALYLIVSGRIIYAVTIALVIGLKLPLFVLFLGTGLDGLSGSVPASMMAFNTYISDVTEPGKQRSFRLTLLEGVIGLTAGLSAFGTGFLIKHTTFLIPVLLALGLIILGLLYTIFILAESYNPVQKCDSLKDLNCNIWRKTFSHYITDTPEKRRSKLILALLGLAFTAPPIIGSSDVITLYILNLPFCWSPDHIGTFSAVQIVVRWGISLTAVKLLQRYFSDSFLIIIGNFSNCLSHIVLAFARHDSTIYVSASVGAFAYIGLPYIRSTMSKLVRQDEQGSLFAGISFIEALSVMVFEIVFNMLYSSTLSFMPGIVFLLMAGMLLFTIVLFIIFEIVSRKVRKELNSIQNID